MVIARWQRIPGGADLRIGEFGAIPVFRHTSILLLSVVSGPGRIPPTSGLFEELPIGDDVERHRQPVRRREHGDDEQGFEDLLRAVAELL